MTLSKSHQIEDPILSIMVSEDIPITLENYVSMNGLDVAWVPMDHQEYSDTGLIGRPGNPFTASAEKGKRIIEKKAEIMAEFIEEVKKIKVDVKNRDYWNRTFRPM